MPFPATLDFYTPQPAMATVDIASIEEGKTWAKIVLLPTTVGNDEPSK